MRHRTALRLGGAAAALLLAGCSTGGGTARPADQLDCTWAESADNCWPAFVAAIDTCLGNVDGGVESGVLSSDRLSCTYASGRSVNATIPLDQPMGEDDSKSARDFTVKSASGAVCLHFVQNAATISAQGPSGTLRWSTDASGLSVTCPNGKVFKGAAAGLLGCLTPGVLPGYGWLNGADRATFTLLGMSGPAYSCATSATPDASVE